MDWLKRPAQLEGSRASHDPRAFLSIRLQVVCLIKMLEKGQLTLAQASFKH